MAADLKSTGTCRYTRTTETFWTYPVHYMLRKNSPYTEIMSTGLVFTIKVYLITFGKRIISICLVRILRLHEAGLFAKWEKRYVPSASKCMKLNELKKNALIVT